MASVPEGRAKRHAVRPPSQGEAGRQAELQHSAGRTLPKSKREALPEAAMKRKAERESK